MFRNIQSRLAITYLVVALVSVIVLGGLFQQLMNQYLIRSAEESLEREAREISRLLSMADPALRDPAEVDSLIRLSAFLTRASIIVVNREGVITMASRDSARVLGQRFTAPVLFQAMESGRPEKTTFRDPFNELSVIVALPVRSPSTRSVTGAVALLRPVSALRSATEQVQMLVIRGALLAGVVAALLAMLLARTLARPVREMTDAASRLGSGDFSQRVPVRGRDEISNLAETFNFMASKIEGLVTGLQEERSRATAVLSNIVDPLLVVTGDGLVEFHNTSGGSFLLPDAAHRSFRETVRYPEVSDFIERSLTSAEQLVEPVSTAEGSHYVATSARFSDAGGGGVVILLRDVTTERRLDQMRRDFVSSISHELRTPVTSIAGFLEALLDGLVEDAEEQSRYLRIVSDETRRLNRLIDDLFDYSRMESGQMSYHMRDTDLATLLADVVGQMRPRAHTAGVSLSLELPPDLPMVRADRDRLRQVLLNLITNALQFTSQGGSVSLTAAVEEDMGSIRVDVTDTGIGIEPKDLPRIFDRFFRAGKRQSGQEGGTGLGLAIARHIVRAHGGEIWASSVVGHGSTFSFRLPTRAS